MKSRLFVWVTSWLLCSSAMAADGAPALTIASGSIRGTALGNVDAFLGVPYAQPPTGSLRWRDPQPAASWHGVRDSTQFSASCYQGPPTQFGPYTAEFLIDGRVSEDCLYLNVWTPRAHVQPLPVLLFIHGGGFGSGSTSIPIYNGTDLAARGIVVVTINYRLGVFGYLARPDLSKESARGTSGNYGILDMIAALHWVRDNIARFGGDPHNVTLAGQSAGAAAVNDLIVAPEAKGLFSHAIAQSGSGMGLHMQTLSQAEQQGAELGKKLKSDSIAALRNLPPQALMEATVAPPPAPGSAPRAMPPSYSPNVDGKVIAVDPGDPQAPIQSKVALLTGFNYDEGAIFSGRTTSPSDFDKQAHERYGKFADRLLALYPHTTEDEATRSSAELARDRYMASLVLWSEARSKSSGEPIYTYLFDHPYPSANGKSFGAFHTAETPYIFGALGQGDRHFDERDKEVSHLMQDYWLSFCKAGRPSAAGQPAWEPVSARRGGMVMGLGDTRHPRTATSTAERLQVLREYVADHGQLSLF